MSRKPTWLTEHADNVNSQAGEDGVIRRALDVLPEPNQWVVEFGAWDGKFLCNSHNLVENYDYRAVLIEGLETRYRDLQRNYADRSDVITVNQFVGREGKDALDNILRTQAPELPQDFDLLSIDIDGNDYHVWQALDHYRPQLLMIEFNPTIPTEVDFVQPYDPNTCHGASLSSLVELGKEKGYELVAALPFNAIFTTRELFDRFEISDNRPQVLRTDTSLITYLFSGYDGTVFLSGHQNSPWHRMPLKARRFQVLPRFMRKHPCSFNRLERKLLSLIRRAA